jgi:hypothetical protein
VVDPRTVTSPKGAIEYLDIVFECEEYSIAVAVKHEERRMMIRWNGENGKLGYPSTRGIPVWFDLPPDLALHIARTFDPVSDDALEFLEARQ